MNHNEVYTDSWKKRKHEWVDFVKNDIFLQFFHMQDIVKQWKKLGGLDWKIVYAYWDWDGNFFISSNKFE